MLRVEKRQAVFHVFKWMISSTEVLIVFLANLFGFKFELCWFEAALGGKLERSNS